MKPQLSLEAFAEFCERKPAHEEFNICSPRICAVGLFAKSLGFERGSDPDFAIDAGRGRSLPIQGLTDKIMCDGERTFGALAARLRAAAKAEGH